MVIPYILALFPAFFFFFFFFFTYFTIAVASHCFDLGFFLYHIIAISCFCFVFVLFFWWGGMCHVATCFSGHVNIFLYFFLCGMVPLQYYIFFTIKTNLGDMHNAIL